MTHRAVRALVDRLARGDRSTALALHALISAADAAGVGDFDHAAKVYRDDHLAALRASGRDAEQEAGRLSLDEVRQHLTQSVLPRLAADGVIAPPPRAGGPWQSIRFTERVWRRSRRRAKRSRRRSVRRVNTPGTLERPSEHARPSLLPRRCCQEAS